MSRSRSAAALLGAGALGLTLTAPVAAEPTAESSAGATSVCSGISHCRVVSRADVDGDGRADQVGLVEFTDDYGTATTRSDVRVRTARGRTMRKTINGYWGGQTSWHGSASIDGQRGYELVLGRDMGTHAMFFSVLTYRNGQLATLKAPGGSWTWLVDSHFNMNAGWYRTMTGGMHVTAVTSLRDQTVTSSRPHRQTKTRYRWSGGRWVKRSSSTSWVSDTTAMRSSGWHVPYLQRFPRY